MMNKSIALAILVIAWLMASRPLAASAWPVPLYTPELKYSEAIRKLPQPHKAILRIQIRADGSVRFVEVVEAGHPEFVALARETVEQWRFEPWTPPVSKPEGEVLKVTFDYSVAGSNRPRLDDNLKLRKLLCHQLNEELRRKHAWWLPGGSSDVGILQQTENYLSHGPLIVAWLAEERRQALVEGLLEARDEVIAKCKAKPASLYVDQLPEAVRAAL